jgi:hypothetical protein
MPARRLTLIGFIAAIVLAVPMTVLASHQFSDVPNSSFYHNDISALAGAGVTTGCGGGKYCPANAVTREQMATFLHRGLGRAAMSTTSVDTSIVRTDGFVTVSAVSIDVGGVGGNQFVDVRGEVTAAGTLTGCGDFCYVNARLRDADTGTLSSTAFYRFSEEGIGDQDVVGKSWVFTAAPGTHTYQLQVAVFQTDDPLTVVFPTVIATTHAFGSTGTSTLSLSGIDAGSSASDSGSVQDAAGQ